MPEVVLRHALGPTMHPGQAGRSRNAEATFRLGSGEHDERLVVSVEDLALQLTGTPEEDPDQFPAFGRPVLPFPGGPGAGQDRAPLDAGYDVAVPGERMRDLVATVGQGHDRCRNVRDRAEISDQLWSQYFQQIGGPECRRGDDDGICRDRFSMGEAQVERAIVTPNGLDLDAGPYRPTLSLQAAG